MFHRFSAAVRASLALSLALVSVTSIARADGAFVDAAPVAAPVPLVMSSLKHAWNFDEGAGSHIAHDSVGGVDGVGGSDAMWIAGYGSFFGPAHDKVVVMWPAAGIDDPNANVDFGRAVGTFGAADFTVTHSVATSHASPGTLSDVVGNRTSYGHGNFFAVRMRGDGILSVELDQDGAGTNYVGLLGEGKRVNDSYLHQLAYVREGARLSLYVDGALVNSAQTASGQPTFVSGADSFRIGRRAPFAFTSLVAFYDDLRIYGRALTAAEVQVVANGG
jgi:hypothetical protein